jgi:hypothetical protein
MNLLIERVEENWRAMGLVSAAVTLSACTVITQVPISGTDISPTATPPIEMRPPLDGREGSADEDAVASRP